LQIPKTGFPLLASSFILFITGSFAAITPALILSSYAQPPGITKPNIAVIWFPGNNCEIETLEAVEAAGMDGKILRWNTKENLSNYDGFVIPGGWAYEDRIRAGVIAAKDPVMNKIKEEASKGKPVLGICKF